MGRPPCALCGVASAVFDCSGCRVAAYCGLDCQRKHWSSHRPGCRQRPHPVDCAGAPGSAAVCIDAAGVPVSPASSSKLRASPSVASSAPLALNGGLDANGCGVRAAGFDVELSGQNSVETAQRIVDVLRDRGVCVIKANAAPGFQKAMHVEASLLWDSGAFSEAQKCLPTAPGSKELNVSARDDKVAWLTKDFVTKHQKMCKHLANCDRLLEEFGVGLKPLLEEQLDLPLSNRTPGMLACYAGDAVPGARYDYHVDNPYQTAAAVPDDKRRLTVIYYISDGEWDIDQDGGALEVLLAGPRRAPDTCAEAMSKGERLRVAPQADTIVVFFAHKMYHAVLPVSSHRRRFALSTWFRGP